MSEIAPNTIGQRSILTNHTPRELGSHQWDGKFIDNEVEEITIPAGTQVICVTAYDDHALDLFEIVPEANPMLQGFYQEYGGMRFVMSRRKQATALLIPPSSP